MDYSRDRVEKKAVRFKVLRALFVEKHGHEPKDRYCKYILELVCKLGEVYDDVTDEARGLRYTQRPDTKKRLEQLKDQENALNNISSDLRKVIGISSQHCGVKEKGEKYERRPQPIQSRPRQSPETLLQPPVGN